jgi:hypothetical protein
MMCGTSSPSGTYPVRCCTSPEWLSVSRSLAPEDTSQNLRGQAGKVFSFAAIDAQGLYAEPSHLVCSISDD